MPPKKKRKKKAKPPVEKPSFMQRRSTKWLFAAIITLAIGVGVGVVGNQLGGDDEPGDAAIPTATAGAER